MTLAPASPHLDPAASRALLQGLYLELTAEIEQVLSAAVATTGADSAEDEADVGSRAAQQQHELTVVSSIVARRDQVEAALQRLAQGTYGLCDTCGEAIPAERLEVCPSVTECVGCKGARERRD